MARAYRSLLLFILFALSYQAHAANRYWIATASSNWNNTANWSTSSGGAGGASVPGTADNANFDNNGTGNCTFDIAVSITKITVSAGYTGMIVEGVFSLSTSGNATFSGGTFSGGSGTITVGGDFTLSGGIFTSTTAVLEFDGNSSFTSGTFNHNNGTVSYVATGGNTTISGTSPAFYNLAFAGEGYNYNMTSTGHLTVAESLDITGSLSYNLNTDTIDVSGNILVTNTAAGSYGTALINIIGSGPEVFTGSTVAGAGALPMVTIDKPSGTLSLVNYPASSNSFTYTSGTINPGTSTWYFTNGSANPYSITGSVSLNNIGFLAIANTTFTITAGTTLTTTGDLTIAGTSKVTLNAGNIDVNGNLYLTNTATTGGGSAIITIEGSGSQAIDGTAITAGEGRLPFLTINKPGGTLTLKGNISESRDWDYIAGTVDAASFSSTVAFGGNALNVTSAGMSFYNVSVTANTITLLSSLTALGNLTISAGKLAPGANSINLAGSWNDYGTTGFTEATSTVTLDGSGLQTITAPGGENFSTLVTANTGSGIQLENNTTVATALTMTSGNIDLNSNTLTIGLSTANNGTINYTNGNIINTGTVLRWYKAAAIAGTAGLFPVGNSTDYRPLIVTTTAAPTAGGTISVAYTDASTNSVVSIVDGASTVVIQKNLNWAVAEANGLTGGTYSLQVQGTGYGLIGSVSDMRLTLANSVAGTAGVNGGTTSDPQVNQTGLTLGDLNNSFYIGSVDAASSPLPLNLLYFNGVVNNGEVILDWATSSDNTAVTFLVQRSMDGAHWQDLRQVAADDDGGTNHYYSAADAEPYAGTSFYRLLQTDATGNSLYSNVLSFTLGNSSGSVSVYPVPATNFLTVSFAQPGNYVVELLNSLGQPVRESQASLGASVSWQTAGLAPGPYFVRIIHDGVAETRTVLIE